ncbi:MAG: YitT family protein [Clostridiales bacterium]|nr:YitT family protein [Clostridiales bacterium]
MNKEKILYWTKTAICMLVSTFLISFAAYTLIAPNEFTVGGASGIAVLLNAAFSLPQSVTLFCLNFPLVVLGFFFVKKKFAILSCVHTSLQSVWLFGWENLFPDFQIKFDGNADKIFAAIATGLCIGVALALAFKIGGSTGGVDILAVIIGRKVGANSIAWMIFTVNFIIVGCSIFVFQGETPALTLLPIMTSAFALYVAGKTNEAVTNGFQSAIEFRIITDKPEEMATALMSELNRGATAQPAKGMYTNKEHTMIICVIHRRQVATLKRIIKRVDPNSFAVMGNVSQVLGLGFYSEEV